MIREKILWKTFKNEDIFCDIINQGIISQDHIIEPKNFVTKTIWIKTLNIKKKVFLNRKRKKSLTI